MSKNRNKSLQGWTLSETLVMMIVAGIVFVSVMDGITLFNRYASLKTRQIVGNMRLWEGYYLLRDLTAAADSVSIEGARVMLFCDYEPVADLFETDSLLMALHGPRTDTLMSGISELTLAADTVRVTIRNTMIISFPVTPPKQKMIQENLFLKEEPYNYDYDK
jgi:hypothetical protein